MSKILDMVQIQHMKLVKVQEDCLHATHFFISLCFSLSLSSHFQLNQLTEGVHSFS